MQNYSGAGAQTAGVRLLSEDEIHAVSGGVSDLPGVIILTLAGLYFAGVLEDAWNWLFG